MDIVYENSYLFSSSTEDGAVNVAPDGSAFEVTFPEPFTVPADAKNVSVSVEEATYWNVSPNILTGINDVFRVIFNGVPHNLIIPQGLYDFLDLTERLEILLQDAGLSVGLVTIGGIESSQTVVINFSQANTYVDFTVASTPRDLLGFDAVVVGTGVAGTFEEGTSPAKFNTIEYLLISSDLVSRGIQVNGRYQNVIDRILIDETPGTQIISRPFNPAKIPANFLAGSSRSRMRFWLTDQAGRPVNTAGETWSFRIVVKYHLYRLKTHNIN
jgi:hypothetical protein